MTLTVALNNRLVSGYVMYHKCAGHLISLTFTDLRLRPIPHTYVAHVLYTAPANFLDASQNLRNMYFTVSYSHAVTLTLNG